VRIRRKHNGNFAIIPNALVEDKRLSIEAKGLLAYLISRPDDWVVKHGHLQRALGIGRDKLQRILRELIQTGYLERDDEQPRDGHNQFAAYAYICRDVPSSSRPPLHGLPLRGSRSLKTRNGINKTDSLITESNKTPSKPSPPQQADLLNVAEEELTEYGRAAFEHGCAFVLEGSKPFDDWLSFRGDDGMPPIIVETIAGQSRRGVWLQSLYPPHKRRREMTGGADR
jgi:hypothetical protein